MSIIPDGPKTDHLALLREARECLEEMANDLEAELTAKYGTAPHVHPTINRLFNRDIINVRSARAIIERLKAAGA